MIIHGDDDRILPADATSRRQAKMIKGVKYVEIKGGSHAIEELDGALVAERRAPKLAGWSGAAHLRSRGGERHSPTQSASKC
jgi:pimeloyl-ACP methyl ester carboxylesterase